MSKFLIEEHFFQRANKAFREAIREIYPELKEPGHDPLLLGVEDAVKNITKQSLDNNKPLPEGMVQLSLSLERPVQSVTMSGLLQSQDDYFDYSMQDYIPDFSESSHAQFIKSHEGYQLVVIINQIILMDEDEGSVMQLLVSIADYDVLKNPSEFCYKHMETFFDVNIRENLDQVSTMMGEFEDQGGKSTIDIENEIDVTYALACRQRRRETLALASIAESCRDIIGFTGEGSQSNKNKESVMQFLAGFSLSIWMLEVPMINSGAPREDQYCFELEDELTTLRAVMVVTEGVDCECHEEIESNDPDFRIDRGWAARIARLSLMRVINYYDHHDMTKLLRYDYLDGC